MKKILSIFATLLFTELMFSCAPEAEEGGMFALVEESPGYYYSSSSFRLSSSSILMSSSSANSFTYGGQTYKTVKIGTQTWMAENLNYAVASTSACYDNLAANCNKYGRLYTWAAAQTVCPSGWHLPSQAEWNVLSDYVGGLETTGKHLKAKNGWTENGNGQDTYGFTALPGGYGYLGGQFKDVGEYGSWWSSTEDNSNRENAYSKNMYNVREFTQWDSDEKSYMVSVRCLQNQGASVSSSSLRSSSSGLMSSSSVSSSSVSSSSVSSSSVSSSSVSSSSVSSSSVSSSSSSSPSSSSSSGISSSSGNICGGTSFNPSEQGCCGSAIYNLTNQRCQSSVIETKCGATGWYNAANTDFRCRNDIVESRCGTSWLNATDGNFRCQNNIIETKCGTGWYNDANSNVRCENNLVETKCGTSWYDASKTNLRCQSNIVETRCGTSWYDARNTMLRCESNVVETECGESWYNYNSSTDYCSDGNIEKYGTVTLSGQTYKTVVIGDQTWMAENLNVAGGSCYDNVEANCDKYGKLYTWSVAMGSSASSVANPSGVRGICPAGWHIPSQAEWNVLSDFIGNNDGRRLKAQEGWDSCGNSGSGRNYLCEDIYGFAALPGGYYHYISSSNYTYRYQNVGSHGYWWSTNSNTNPQYIVYNIDNTRWGGSNSNSMLSVRCVKD